MKSNRQKLILVLQRHIINDAEKEMLTDILTEELRPDIREKLSNDLDIAKEFGSVLSCMEIELINKITL